ncbi:MAG TPA: PAS domain S-box protein [Negativicutes bacterium]|nr:PAS domain S-box protein [Negativicutes bacterium]
MGKNSGLGKTSAETLYQLLMDNMPMKIFYKDPNSVYIWCNDSYAKDLKLAAADIVGKNDHEFYRKDLAEKYIADDRRIMQHGKIEQIEERYVQDGQEAFIRTIKTPVKDAAGKTIGLLGVFTDITSSKLAQIRMEESEAKYRTLIETTDTGFAIIDQVGTILDANPEYIRLSGATALTEIMGKKATQWTADYDREKHLAAINKCFTDGRIKNITLDFVDGKGHTTPVEVSGATIEGGGIKRAFKLARDVTERKAAEKSLEERSIKLENLNQALKTEIEERRRAEEIVSRQAREILEVSIPVVQLWEGIVSVPLIGTLDSQRTQQLMERLLQRIVETNSSVALIDVTGVPAIDTQTAQHLIETIKAVQLLGAQVILTGIRPAIAQTLVHLGINLSNVNTRSSMASGLIFAMDLMGLRVVNKDI